MPIRHVSIKNFRGIKNLEWGITGSTICLIGPNDSCKSTILEAILYALSPRWNLIITDSDFFRADTSQKIEIIITFGNEIPVALMSTEKFGGQLRGINDKNEFEDEPIEGFEPILSICLRIDDALEPQWHVIRDPSDSTRDVLISAKDRELFNAIRLGSYVDREFTWSRGSLLSRITDTPDAINATLAHINREVRDKLTSVPLDKLDEITQKVQSLAMEFGVPSINLKAGIDAQTSIGSSGLAIHDENIPLRQLGLGSRRLLVAAIQKSLLEAGSILLADEIEQGLEPHRLRHLIRLLRVDEDNQKPHLSQTIVTTHSTSAICEYHANEICVIRNNNGDIVIKSVSEDLQDLVRSLPDAFLARKIIVCEGKTELGLIRAMDNFWSKQSNGDSLTYYGVIAVNGDGNANAPKKAIEFSKLGYEVLLFADSDEPISPPKEEVEKHGNIVILWSDSVNTESRVLRDVPFEVVQKIIDAAIDDENQQSRLGQIQACLDPSKNLTTTQLDDWIAMGFDEHKIRNSIAEVAHRKKWFKNITLGEEVGRIVTEILPQIDHTDLYKKLEEIREWAMKK